MGCDNTIFFLTPAHEVSAMASVEAIITASAALPIIFRAVRRDIPLFSFISQLYCYYGCKINGAKINIKNETCKFRRPKTLKIG